MKQRGVFSTSKKEKENLSPLLSREGAPPPPFHRAQLPTLLSFSFLLLFDMSSPYAHHSGTGGFSGSGGTPTMKQKGGPRRAKFGGCCCAAPRGVSFCSVFFCWASSLPPFCLFLGSLNVAQRRLGQSFVSAIVRERAPATTAALWGAACERRLKDFLFFFAGQRAITFFITSRQHLFRSAPLATSLSLFPLLFLLLLSPLSCCSLPP